MFADWFTRDPTPVLKNDRLMLRAPLAADYDEWRRVRLASRNFLKPYEPRWTEADVTRRVFRDRLNRSRAMSAKQTEFSFFIFLKESRRPELAGGITLTNIRRRVAQHVSLGYWMAELRAGKGVMTEAAGLVLPFIFNDLDLHRAMAACLPHNTASRRVLEKNRFREEGFAEGYLYIDGKWQDHVLYGLTRERFETSDLTV